MLRFVHSSDLHLGKPFGRMDEELRGRLREERFRKIGALGGIARQEGASHILLAGDLFDAQTPSPSTRRQALQAMAREDGVTWVILPGNHDSLAADALWRAMQSERPANIVLALTPEPIQLGDHAVLLPAPCPARRPGRDLTAWMDAAETGEAIRIGLAHGSVQSFSEEGGADTIAPDRAVRARLDYLALGDWHGQVGIGPNTWYSGTPEADRFKHEGRASALVVSVAGPGAPPDVRPVETGLFDWRMVRLDLAPESNGLGEVERHFSEPGRRRDTLLRLTLEGRMRAASRAELSAFLENAAPDFGLLEIEDRLSVEYEADDLDRIDRAGVLRSAAERLAAEARDDALSAAERGTARRALDRLYSLAVDVE